jgi:hypothetical protein
MCGPSPAFSGCCWDQSALWVIRTVSVALYAVSGCPCCALPSRARVSRPLLMTLPHHAAPPSAVSCEGRLSTCPYSRRLCVRYALKPMRTVMHLSHPAGIPDAPHPRCTPPVASLGGVSRSASPLFADGPAAGPFLLEAGVHFCQNASTPGPATAKSFHTKPTAHS